MLGLKFDVYSFVCTRNLFSTFYLVLYNKRVVYEEYDNDADIKWIKKKNKNFTIIIYAFIIIFIITWIL